MDEISTVMGIFETEEEAKEMEAEIKKEDWGYKNYYAADDDNGGFSGEDGEYVAAKRGAFAVDDIILPHFAYLGLHPFQVMSLDGTEYSLELPSTPPKETIDLTELLRAQYPDQEELNGAFKLWGKDRKGNMINLSKIDYDEGVGDKEGAHNETTVNWLGWNRDLMLEYTDDPTDSEAGVDAGAAAFADLAISQ